MSTSSSHSSHGEAASGHGKIGLTGLVVGAIGVVFGDIGTSPLYTLKEMFSGHYGLQANHDTVLGVLSLVFWALTIVVTLKYVTIIMRADNDGEGGIMALMALAQRTLPKGGRSAYLVGILGVFGASLFFGDGVITPAVSVLSAIEGIEVVAPQMRHWIVPLTVVVLTALFATQRFGTEKVGKVFGPITIAWFLCLAVLGVVNILHETEVLHAINPWWAYNFFAEHHWHGILIFGAVVLAVTGGEALYTDMGHFGAKPIRLAWYWFVLPSLMLNYLGQGALILEDPEAIRNPFYIGVPEWGRVPMIVLATAATVIASQAVITGGFSIARQAMQLGYIPRMTIKHTSHDTIGQIYIPGINWGLMVMVIGLVLGAILGTLTALGLVASPLARQIVRPTLVLTQALPVFALAPILTLWLGYGMGSKIVIAVLIIYFPVTSAFFDGLTATPPGWLDLARTMQARPTATLWRIRVPAALPALASGLRLAAVYAPIGAVIGEWVGASRGLGYLMLLANGRAKTDLMFAALVVLALMTLALYRVVGAACDRLAARFA